jgi:diacylglycerol kinase (ATP)
MSSGASGSPQRRALVIENPVAGGERPHRLVTQVAFRMRRFGWYVEIRCTRYRGHATELAARAAAQGCDLVIAAGGDGTINEVLQPLVGSHTALGVIPVGTVNIWAHEISLPRSPDLLAALLAVGPRRCVDVGNAGGRYFLLMAGIGLDAAVVAGVDVGLKQQVGRWAYALALLQQAGKARGVLVDLTIDGTLEQHRMFMLVAGNTRRYAGFFRITPEAQLDDGLLDLCIVPGDHVAASLPQVAALLTGLRPLRSRLVYRRARRVTVAAERPLHLQVDGDFVGYSPVTIECMPRALTVVIPERAGSALFTQRE